MPVDLDLRVRFNPNLTQSWFGGVIDFIFQVSMIAMVLTGASLIREREHGTIEHLLVMPVTPFQIMTSKIWSMGLVVLAASAGSLQLMIRGVLGVPVAGSITLFLIGTALHLFATTSLGIFLATVGRTMPQFALLLILVLFPMQMLSGRLHAVREHALGPPEGDARGADHSLRLAEPGHHLPRRRAGRRVAAVRGARPDRRRPVCPVAGPFPEDHRGDGMSPRVPMKSAAWLLVILLLPGCMVGPDYHRPDMAVPADWRTAPAQSTSLADVAWWEVFSDPDLQELIRGGVEANRDVQAAVARVFEARAQLGVARAALFPQISAGASYSYTRPYSNNSFFVEAFPGIPAPTGSDLQTGVDLTFELDLWGRLRRATEAARAELLASEDSWRSILITLVADIARTYFDLLELDREIEIARRTLETRRGSLDLQSRRAERGLSTQLDVQRAAAEVAVAAAAVPDLERRIAQTENAVNVLLGRNPGPVRRGAPLDAQRVPPAVPAGLPSALLERRPDVRQAEQTVMAANARIGEAKAAFFPRISLTGMFGVESVSLSDLLTGGSKIWRAGPTMTVPIFTAGRISNTVRANEARQQQAVAQYRQTIERAFREVDDALVFHQKVREIRAEQERRVAATRQALYLATLRYERGLATYLDVLDQERQLFRAELDLASTTRDQLTAVVQVYKALGGGWPTSRAIDEVEGE